MWYLVRVCFVCFVFRVLRFVWFGVACFCCLILCSCVLMCFVFRSFSLKQIIMFSFKILVVSKGFFVIRYVLLVVLRLPVQLVGPFTCVRWLANAR